MSNGTELPSYDDRYYAATAGLLPEAKVVDTAQERDVLQSELAKAGYEVTKSRDLRETMTAWHHDKGTVPPKRLKSQIDKSSEK